MRSHIHQRKVNPGTGGQWKIRAAKTVGLADAAAHGHAVYGVAQAFFGDGNDESHRSIAAAARILTPDGPQRVGKMAVGAAAAGKKHVYGHRRTEFFFLIQAQALHRRGRG